MRRFTSLPRPLLMTLAILFAAASTLWSVIWMIQIRGPIPDVGLVFDDYSPASHSIQITEVERGGPGERAGIRVGDRVVAINGRHLDNVVPYYEVIVLCRLGETIQFAVERTGTAGHLEFRVVTERFMASQANPTSQAQRLLGPIMGYYPLFFLIVGLTVLFLRLEDPHAWRLTLLFGSFIASAPLFARGINPSSRGFMFFWQVGLANLAPGLFYYFFATFPAPSPIERKLPWLKYVLLGYGLAFFVPLSLWCLFAGGPLPLLIYGSSRVSKITQWPSDAYYLGSFALGFASLIWNSIRPSSAEVRRKTRVIVWGAILGIGPLLLFIIALIAGRVKIYDFPFVTYALVVICLATFLPLSFAYAVVKHRVLEIPVLVKRSARYLLVQRGVVVLTFMISISASLLCIALITRTFKAYPQIALPAGIAVGILIGAVFAVANMQFLPRVSKRIDRAFFRSAYDARQILEDLAEKIRKASSQEKLAALLEGEIQRALHPTAVSIYFQRADGLLTLQGDQAQPAAAAVSPDAPLLQELARRAAPWEIPPPVRDGQDGSLGISMFGPDRPECLVPILASDGHLAGLVVLGTRLSEEPYSREDRRLLASVSGQAGVALENIRLAEEMANRIEAERRAAQELEFAKDVQSRLFPQYLPPLKTLDYAGACIQARQVGGDYYDFLDLGPGRVGLVLADISGKGISGALLMANLQANLRSQYAVALGDLPRLLRSVNHLFYTNTADNRYATLFFADYDDSTRRLRYANCGHNPPMLLRADGCLQRLTATATVLGLFKDWDCEISEEELHPGDLMVMYTDGVTEAENDDGEYFDEPRLIDTLRANAQLPPDSLLEAIVASVQTFSGSEQEDDITLVVARCRAET